MYNFVRITPANFLYALWLSVRGPVAAWKVDLPAPLARRFQRIRPYRIWSRDEWLLAHEEAFELWKRRAVPLLQQRHRASVQLGGRSIDFSSNVLQMLGVEFEALSLFVAMLHKTHASRAAPRIVEPWIACAFELGELAQLFPGVRFERSLVNRRLEGLHQWTISTAHLLRTLFLAGLSFVRSRKQSGPRSVVWLGISAVEIPERDERLNFAWAAQYGRVDPRQVLYILPSRAQPAQRNYLEAHGIEAIDPAQTFAVLSPLACLGVAARSIAGFVSALVLPAAVACFVARFMTRAPHWNALFSALHTRAYVTTTSYSWPEKPELAVAASAGIRTIIWAYSANSLTFSIAQPAFRDTGVTRSIVIADEFWVWNEAYARWLEARQVDTGAHCAIRVVGPLMCGDSRLLDLDRCTARERLGMRAPGLCVGIFDMPPINDAWRDRFGGGPPMIDSEMYVAFWALVEQILTHVPDCVALIKMKRGFGHLYRDFPPEVKALLEDDSEHVRAGRVHRVDVNIDPYLPIAACDVALGVTYTSPILAACAIGRPAFYLDPLKRANFPANRDFTALTLSSAEEAIATIDRIRRGVLDGRSRATVVPPAPLFPLRIASDGSLETIAAQPRGALRGDAA